MYVMHDVEELTSAKGSFTCCIVYAMGISFTMNR